MSTESLRKLLDDFGDDRPDSLDEWLFYVRKLEENLEVALRVIEAVKPFIKAEVTTALITGSKITINQSRALLFAVAEFEILP